IGAGLPPAINGTSISAQFLNAVYIAFEKTDFKKIEKDFLDLLCKDNFYVLKQQKACGLPEPPKRLKPNISADMPLKKLNYLFEPSALKSGRTGDFADGANLGLFCAKNYQDEVYQVLEKLAEGRYFADQAEIIYSDAEPYLDIIYNLCRKTGIKVTFSDGLPGDKSVAAKALKGFLSWIKSDFSEVPLRSLLKYGFIKTDFKSGSKLAAILRDIKIGWSKERYKYGFKKETEELEQKIQKYRQEPLMETIYKERLQAVAALDKTVSGLLKITPNIYGNTVNMPEICSCCADFLSGFLKIPESSNTYASEISYANELKKTLETLKAASKGKVDIDKAIQKITDLLISIKFKKEGPRPSALLVSGIGGGGLSGRKNTFIIGMDDHKFLAGQFQDPVLLDEERKKISPELPLSKEMIKNRLYDFASMIADTANGSNNVFMSYSVFDMKDERALFPSSALLQFFRIKDEKPDADYSDLLANLKRQTGQGRGIAAKKAIDQSAWWADMLLSGDKIRDAKQSLYSIYPWLKAGKTALESRKQSLLTVYDGWLGNPANHAGGLERLDPRKNHDFVLSCTSLETFAANPYAFFLEKVLKIRRPEEIRRDNCAWLDAKTRGSLLHDVFEIFSNELKKDAAAGSGVFQDTAGQKKMILNILDAVIEKYKKEIPWPGQSVINREINNLKKDVEVFVEENKKLGIPYLLEYQFGYEGKPPVKIDIGSGHSINIAGRVDRVDISRENGNYFYIWDYKTGSSYGYEDDTYVCGGRQLQHVLYSQVVEKLLKIQNPQSKVIKCGYVFPTLKGRNAGRGCIIERDPHDNKKWQEALQCIIDLISCGVFIISEQENPFYADDEDIYGTAKDKINMKQKINESQNTVLEKYRKLKDFK
ncbi:MAG: PD-(D/E)XK nuclease family protein, partial [Actinobacteria bacterium]|nr:PD-(D/E)XK nuclease family protein [Actinomycetota bacterium]